jgi:hypothetical protein
MLLKELQSNRPLPGNDRVVIERMHKREVLGLATPNSFFVSFVVIRAVQHHIGAISARSRNFDQRRGQRHANLGSDAKLARMICDALRVISRRGRDHALGTFFRTQQQQFVQRATFLESARPLQVVELQINLVGRGLGKRCRQRAGRKVYGIANAAQGRLDVI